jgi:hypothetical protein
MAEIRKFDPATGNAIAQALRAAMGEPVRPTTPGKPAEKSEPPASVQGQSVRDQSGQGQSVRAVRSTDAAAPQVSTFHLKVTTREVVTHEDGTNEESSSAAGE